MTRDSFLRVHLTGFLLLLSFLIALAFALVFPSERVARTLFFPGTTSTELTGERRLLPRTGEQERAVELAVEEMLLGPVQISHSRVFPRETRVRSVIVNDGTVYVDLDQKAIFESREVHVGIETGLAAIRETLLYNFRSLDDVVTTIKGNVPFVPAYRPVGP